MTFREFIETKYDIRERIALLTRNPIREFLESDIFPCDFVDVEGGEMIKKVYFPDGKRDIAVLDLLSYKREDIVKSGDTDLLALYDAYIENFEFDGLDLSDPINIAKIREESLRQKGLVSNDYY